LKPGILKSKNNPTAVPRGSTISFETNQEVVGRVEINGKSFSSTDPTTHHEIEISGLEPAKEYTYLIKYGENENEFSLQTAPPDGSRTSFVFSYASDSRNGQGGGERNLYGANFYIMKKIFALNKFKDVAFMQFSGDLINGYLQDKREINLQYANWKRAVEPFAHYFPVYISMGNHESLTHYFQDSESMVGISVDKFPFDTESAEAVFASNFINPKNGPVSEDGAKYDPKSKSIDFPPYEENVFYYTYDNVAVVVMNSNYWYAPSTGAIPLSGGGLHGYIMDNQLDWLKSTIDVLEKNQNIDHVFLTQHTPFFPNGGHVADDMWYNGDNSYRP